MEELAKQVGGGCTASGFVYTVLVGKTNHCDRRCYGTAYLPLESVRRFLETLVDGGAQSSTLAGYLAAIRTAFDKLCGRDVTLGLAVPRRPKKLPTVPSRQEIVRMLDSAQSLRDKLMIGLLYATGFRVSEVSKLKWSDFDFKV